MCKAWKVMRGGREWFKMSGGDSLLKRGCLSANLILKQADGNFYFKPSPFCHLVMWLLFSEIGWDLSGNYESLLLWLSEFNFVAHMPTFLKIVEIAPVFWIGG